jgi:predicted RNA-binding Zn-ribbon protein involved in translation (DUF1610 family)
LGTRRKTMNADIFFMVGALVALSGLLALFWIVRAVRRRTRLVRDSATLWEGRAYPCPQCGGTMQEGWVMLGRGAIWSPRSAGRPGSFAHIGNALENTLTFTLPPAGNMAWRCPSCRLLLIDHDKMVKR